MYVYLRTILMSPTNTEAFPMNIVTSVIFYIGFDSKTLPSWLSPCKSCSNFTFKEDKCSLSAIWA